MKKFKRLFERYKIDGYIVPKNDEFFSEYSSHNRLKNISNFSGSAGIALILKNENHLFVDGRYSIQADKESGHIYKIHEVPNTSINDIIKKYNYLNIGYDPKVFTSKYLKNNFSKKCSLRPLSENLVDLVCGKNSLEIKSFYYLNKKVTGESSISKIERIARHMAKENIYNLFISSPENVAWLLNLRGFDCSNSPIPNCNIIIDKYKNIYFFSNLKKINKIRENNNLGIKFNSFSNFFNVIQNLKGNNFSLDENSCSEYFEKLISSKFEIIYKKDPCYLFKSIKNKTEITNTIKSHIKDGVALTKFLYWIKNQKKNVSEITAEKKLEKFRKRNKEYLYPSFKTIAGSGPNSAIIHYSANKKSNRILSKDNLFLIDSGGQYKYGTTDVTRTICFNKPIKKIKNIYTRVLKSHISVVNFKLKNNSDGSQIDKVARKNLKDFNLDYPHGTGHGVGYFLNVHEGPQSISKKNKVILKEGMIVSNEPGFYMKNKFGIRIENLIYIKKIKNKLKFENLTFVPIEKDLINFDLLNNSEKNYLKNYHSLVFKKLRKFLNKNEVIWLKNLI